ncbi:twin-arginine translocase subunit TatC [Thermodesulfobacteriota bacterium]
MTSDSPESSLENEKLPFTQHLDELRKRLITCAIAVVIGFLASYAFSKDIYLILAEPIKTYMENESSFIFTGLTEPFFTYLKLALFTGILLSSPVILHQIWCFVAPGLYQKEKKYVLPFVLLSSIFFISGVLFCFYGVFPIACKFFSSFTQSGLIEMKLRMSDYLSFACKFLLAFGVVFEMPIFILFLAKLGIVTHHQLSSNRKYVVVLIFIVGAFLTPPDVVSQVLMALPLLVLYEFSIILARFFGRKPEDTHAAEEESGE